MKKIPIFVLIFLTTLCFGQTEYFYQNDGKKLKTRAEVWREYESSIRMHKLMSDSGGTIQKTVTEPVIYHRVIKSDSIINYYTIRSYFVDQDNEVASDFIIQQDPIFLYLNNKLPDFKLFDIDGNEFSSDQLKDKTTLINFNGTYCKVCLNEIPCLNKLKEKYQDKVNFISIFDIERKPGDIESVLKIRPFDFTILINNETLKKQLDIRSLPYNIFVDKEGIVRYIQKKYNSYSDTYYDEILDELIEKQ
jgi:cytochrome c biogenesis protein CcmG, thiol:disulfide interchange protein DsbE